MEDDLKKIKWRTTSKKKEDDLQKKLKTILKKIEYDLKKRKWKKMEDDL